MWLKLFKNEEELSKRFLNVHPTNYFRLIVQDTFICISRFQNRQPVYRTELVINDGQFQALDILLNSFPSYPVYIVLKGQESHFRVVSFMASRWWHRRSLLKQAEEGEFSETDWVHAQPISSVQDTQRYLLVGVSPGMFLQELVNNLQYLSNPLIGIQLWLIVFADQVFKILKRQNNQINGEWVMIVRQQKPGNWQLIVCHQQVVIFHREGKLSTREAVVDLTGEVTSTMRYLSRHGYQQGDPITLIQIGFEGVLKLEKFQQSITTC